MVRCRNGAWSLIDVNHGGNSHALKRIRCLRNSAGVPSSNCWHCSANASARQIGLLAGHLLAIRLSLFDFRIAAELKRPATLTTSNFANALIRSANHQVVAYDWS
jgi:hypothetical protein